MKFHLTLEVCKIGFELGYVFGFIAEVVADPLVDIFNIGRVLVNLPICCKNSRDYTQNCDDLTAGNDKMAVFFPSFLEFFEFHKGNYTF